MYQVFNDNQQRKTELYAALDIGSNSFHLVVARVVADAFQVVTRVKRKVRLAEGLGPDNMLSQEAIERGIATLESMQESLEGITPNGMRVVATHTLRRAKNAREFLRKAQHVFPYPIEIISGNEEARLIFVGVASNATFASQRLVFDIGGGSTEFAVGEGIIAKICKSIQMGCVSFQRRFFNNGLITQENAIRAITAANIDLELASGNLNRFQWQQVVASSGTAKAACAVINNMNNRPLDAPIKAHELTDLLAQCIQIKNPELLSFEGLSDDRKSVLAPGLCILIAICQSLHIEELIYSDSALREGVLFELQPNHNTQNIRVKTAQSLATRYDVDTNYAHKILTTCMYILDGVKQDWGITNPSYRHLLGWSALLHEVGLQINSRGIQKHSSYVLLNTDLPGFNQEQQQIIAYLVRYHRKKIGPNNLLNEVSINPNKLKYLLIILRLAVVLNINRHQAELPQFSIKVSADEIKVGFDQSWFELSPLLLADIGRENAYLSAIDMHLSLL